MNGERINGVLLYRGFGDVVHYHVLAGLEL